MLGGAMAPRAKTIDLLRVVDLLQEHITPALCRAVFGAVRKSERQRVWTLEALIQFWTAVVLRAPPALSQALADSLEGRDPTFPRIVASPEAFFQRCRDLRPAFFAEVFQRFTARLLTAVPARYAHEVATVQARFAAIVIFDGSGLAPIAHRLKLLRKERAVMLPGSVLAVYDLGRGLCRHLWSSAIASTAPQRSSRPCGLRTAGGSSGATACCTYRGSSACASVASTGACWRTGRSAPAPASWCRPRPCAISVGDGAERATNC